MPSIFADLTLTASEIKLAASKSVIESVPTATITSLPTTAGVYSTSPKMLSVSVSLKPWIVSEPSPARYSITFSDVPLAKLIRSLPSPALIVTFAPLLAIESIPSPVEMEAIAPVLVMVSSPPLASIVAP